MQVYTLQGKALTMREQKRVQVVSQTHENQNAPNEGATVESSIPTKGGRWPNQRSQTPTEGRCTTVIQDTPTEMSHVTTTRRRSKDTALRNAMENQGRCNVQQSTSWRRGVGYSVQNFATSTSAAQRRASTDQYSMNAVSPSVCNAIFAFDNFCCCFEREKVNEGSDALARLRAAERAK